MISKETNDDPTPNGGVRSEAYYLDDNGKPADKSVATAMEIVELDAAGNIIHRTYMRKTPEA